MATLIFQQMAGFTLLEGVLILTVSSITTATALSYLDNWMTVSEQATLHYSQQVALSSMQTHQIWAKASGKQQPQWQDVIAISGLDSHISKQGKLALKTAHQYLCIQLDNTGDISSSC